MKIITFISLAALGLSACDSKQEAVRKAEIDARAKHLELDAEVAKNEAAAKSEVLKAEADRVREQK